MIALAAVYPEQQWRPWLFDKLPGGFWNDTKNQRDYVDWAAEQLNVKNFDDWYRVAATDLLSIRGSKWLNRYYSGSVFDLLMSVYPEHQWDQSAFQRGSNKSPSENEDARNFLSQRFGITIPEEWNFIRSEDIVAMGK
jgi:hypothetical protein